MKSTDGGHHWSNNGILLEDYQPRLILRPHNTGINFAGGTGDPSSVVSGTYLYIFMVNMVFQAGTTVPLMTQLKSGKDIVHQCCKNRPLGSGIPCRQGQKMERQAF